MPRRIVYLVVLLIGVLTLLNLFRSLWELWGRRNIVADQEQKLIRLKREKEELERRLFEVQDPFFIEKQARDKLGMGFEGESVIILPKIKNQDLANMLASPGALPNWQKWLRIFF